MDIFKGQNVMEFIDRFQTDENCKEYLAQLKWQDGYKCRKCGHTKCQQRKDFSRTCNICSYTESATANTLFHKVKFGIKKAFFICFEMATSTKSLSARYVATRFGVTQNTARLFMHKVREAMKSSGNHPMGGFVQVDEFTVGGKEDGKIGRSNAGNKKKAVVALQLTENGKVKRMYAMGIEDYSSREIGKIFRAHICENAKVKTDLWRGYRPLMKEYTIEQVPSNNGKNFPALHTMIHQVKSWIRTIYSYVSKSNLNRYFNEFCYRLNRSQNRETIFNNLLKRMVVNDHVSKAELYAAK